MRERLLISSFSVVFFLLGVSLFYTQVVRYPYYSRLSKNNSIRIIPIEGPRGVMLDRNGIALVSNRLSFDVALVYQELKDIRKLSRLLAGVLGLKGDDITRSIDKAGAKPYAPVVIAEDIEKDKAIELEEASFDVSGLMIQTRSKRDYAFRGSASHISGYLGEVTEDELENLRDYGYRPRDLIGRDGLEGYYDKYLRGQDGGTQIEVDSRGRQTRIIGLKEPVGGKDLKLSIDTRLQSVCDRLLGEHNGAIIVMDPKNGEVLSLASHPSYDPNIFIRSDTSEDRMRLIGDTLGRPLSNRAISGLFPPGSVFKIVTASAGLETGSISKDTEFTCLGSYRLGKGKFDCWKETGHGLQNVVEGLMNSCNVFFYHVGRLAGADNLEASAKAFGYGRVTGIDLPDEVKGLAPGKVWKRFYRNDGWYEGETLNYAIGQGYLLATPLQIVCMTAVIANGGNVVRPHLVNRIGSQDVQAQRPKKIGLNARTINLIRQGMFEVVNNETGTGRYAKIEGASIAGKTGTAENPHGRTHAWFTGFAPYSDPKICIVVFLEHGGKGGLEPASIARGVFQEAKNDGYI